MEKGRYRTNDGINFLGLLTILFIGVNNPDPKGLGLVKAHID